MKESEFKYCVRIWLDGEESCHISREVTRKKLKYLMGIAREFDGGDRDSYSPRMRIEVVGITILGRNDWIMRDAVKICGKYKELHYADIESGFSLMDKELEKISLQNKEDANRQ